MSWPRACAVCGSWDVQAHGQVISCLVCGRFTDKNGKAVPEEIQFSNPELHSSSKEIND